jgi:hypothetical protein
MTVGETGLDRATNRLAEQQERVVRQEARIARLDQMGLPQGKAIEFLGLMENLLEEMRKRAARISN